MYNNRGTRAKDSRSFQGSALCIFLTAVLFNLPLIIVFCPRVYEDRPMIRITRGADYSSPLHPSLTSLGIPLSPLNAHVSVRSKKERNEKKRNPFSNRFFISFGFLMFNFSLFYFSFFFIFFFSFSEILSLNYEDLVLIFFFDNGVGQLKEIRIVFTSRARRERERERRAKGRRKSATGSAAGLVLDEKPAE